MIVRTAVLDELIVRTIARDGVDTVLNLAAGSTPARTDCRCRLRSAGWKQTSPT